MNDITAKLKEFGVFVKESWTEVRHKVTWPTREEVRGTTTVVLVTTLIFAVYLGVIDYLMFRLVDFFFDTVA